MKLRRIFVIFVISILGIIVGQQTFSAQNQEFSAFFSVFYNLLQPQEKVTKLIVAEVGGSLNLSGITLSIPPDALTEDTIVTLSSVKGSQFDGDVATLGGVNALHIIGAVFEPDGTVLNTPAVVRFSLPGNWTFGTELVMSVANGNDPLDVMETTQEFTISGSPGSYVAEVELSHFSSEVVSRVCHEGSYNTAVEAFTKNACTDQLIKDQITEKYGISVDPTNAELMGPEDIQAFLGTYFDEYGSPYNKDQPISADTIAYLKEKVRAGLQVVIAFSHKADTWPPKGGDHDFYPSLPHTAILEKDENGNILVRHTLSLGGFVSSRHDKLKELMGGGTISYTDPLDNINVFRTTKNGEIFKRYVQDKWPGEFPDSYFNVFPKSYGLAKVYIDHRNDKSQNPCNPLLRDLQNCLCACLQGTTEFWCRYDTEDLGWSPSCRNLTNGPCICQAYGCYRAPPVTSGVCYDSCIDAYGN